MAPRKLTKDRQALLQSLDPDERALFEALRPEITPEILQIIASADYGSDDEIHLQHLTKLLHEENFDKPLEWEPKEVLELSSWSPADYRGSQHPITEKQAVLVQGFSTLCLLRAYGHRFNQNDLMGMNQRVIILLDTLDKMEKSFTAETLQFLSWLTLHLPDHDDETAFFLFALMTLLLENSDNVDQKTKQLLDWCVEAEEEIEAGWTRGIGDFPGTWLLRTTHFNSGAKRWIKRAKRLRPKLETFPASPARDQLISRFDMLIYNYC